MSRSVLALALIACALLVSGAAAWNKLDFENYLIGFGEGLESDFSSNITLCIGDEQAAGIYLGNGYTLVEKGLKDKSVSEIRSGFQNLGLGFQEVAAVLKVCNFSQVVTDVEKIAAAFKSGAGGVVEIVIKELVGIFIKRTEVTNDFKVAIASWKAGDYQKSGYATGNLVGILIEDGKRK